MRSSLETLRNQVAADLDAGIGGREACQRFAHDVEALVASCIQKNRAQSSEQGAGAFFVLSAGGVSRGALAPRADVDLLFVTRNAANLPSSTSTETPVEEDIESILYSLWDEGLVLGHAVRTEAEHLEMAAEDPDSATALLESRPLWEQDGAATDFIRRLWRDWLPLHRAPLREAKKRELAERRTRFGRETHLVEPNIKQSPGGLRDIDSLYWLSLLDSDERAVGRPPFEVMLDSGMLTPRAASDLARQCDILLSLRAAIHLVAGRGEDRLLFQVQEDVASLCLSGLEAKSKVSYSGSSVTRFGERDSEALLRHYFCASRRVKRIVDDALERFAWRRPDDFDETNQADGHPFLPTSVHPILSETGSSEPRTDRAQDIAATGSLHGAAHPKKRRLEKGLYEQSDFLFSTKQKDGLHPLTRAVDAVRVSTERKLRLAPVLREEVYRNVARNLPLDISVGAAFGRLFRSAAVQGDAFYSLLEMGVLGAYFEDIRRLEGRFKQDGYHAYTTDAHLCHCADLALRAVSTDALVPEPLREIYARVQQPHLWVLGAFFHDLGKGLPEDHAVVGEKIVRKEASKLGCNNEEKETLAFLVRAHLVLSVASQRRDLSDPNVVEELAEQVLTPERLDLLALLTWVDIASVAPGMFSDWKARLLAYAVERVRAYLLDPEAGAFLRGENDAEVRQRTRQLLLPHGSHEAVKRFVDGASIRALGSRIEHELIADFQAFENWNRQDDVLVDVTLADGRRAHIIRIVCQDRPALLADLTSALSAQGANILHAQIDAREDGVALDAFRVERSRGRPLSDETMQHIVGAVRLAAGQSSPAAPHKSIRRARRNGPPVVPRVRFFRDIDHWGALLVEIRADDRPGLVARVSHTFSRLGWDIVLAKINTEGRVARDAFYVMPSVPEAEEADFAALEQALLDVLQKG